MTYEIVKQIGFENSGRTVRESNLVKLGSPAICRATGTFDLYETDYVIVEALRILEDGIAYEETHVVASDENGKANAAILYQATRALTIQEAMFSIGEHNFDSEYKFPDPEPDGNPDTSAVVKPVRKPRAPRKPATPKPKTETEN